MDTWLDAIRNLRNYCAHHSMLVGMTSSVVILDNNRDNRNLLPDDTNLFSRLYALKKVLPEKEATCLGKELETLISKTKLDIYRMNILPRDWKDLYQQTSPL